MAVLDTKTSKEYFKDVKEGDKIYSAYVELEQDKTYTTKTLEYTFKKLADAPTKPVEPTEKTSATMEKYARTLKAYEKYAKSFEEGLFAEVQDTSKPESAIIVVNLLQGVFKSKKEVLSHLKEELSKMLASVEEALNE